MVRTPSRLRDPLLLSELEALAPDVMIVVDYGLIIPAALLRLPRFGCINGHASLLPRWRGAAPIERAILAGDTHTGITVMQMDEGLDTGDMLLRRETPISPDETAGELRARLAGLCAGALVEALVKLAKGLLKPVPQPDTGACYAEKLTPGDARLRWSRPAEELSRVVRAFQPRPGAWTLYRGQRIKILQASAIERVEGAPPGTVLGGGRDGMEVSSGRGVLRIVRLQLPGGRPMDAAAFLNGHPAVGVRLGEDGP